MATNQFRIEDELTQGQPGERQPNRWKGCLIGCLIVFAVLLLAGIIGVIWVSRNLKDWAATGITVAIKQGLEQTDLPPEERAEVMVEVERGAALFREGRISNEQAAFLMQKLVESPLFTAFAASAADKKYIDPSGLSDEEKADASLALQRFARGVIDGKIDQQSMDTVLRHVGTKNGQNWEFKDKIGDDEVRAFVAAAKKTADDAGVAAAPEEVDPSDEMKRIIDEALANQGGGPVDADFPPPLESSPAPETTPPAETPPAPDATAPLETTQ